MSWFDDAFEYTMRWEGGDTITEDPHDPGGLTKYGISQRAFPDLDIRSLTLNEAKHIYRLYYWDTLHLDSIKSYKKAIKLFDTAVNVGIHKATMLAQSTYNAIDPTSNLYVDGRMGPLTLGAINIADTNAYLNEFCSQQERFYISLNKPRFIKGWTRRARSLPNDHVEVHPV